MDRRWPPPRCRGTACSWPQGDGEWASRGSFVFEVFQVLVDLDLRDEDWTSIACRYHLYQFGLHDRPDGAAGRQRPPV